MCGHRGHSKSLSALAMMQIARAAASEHRPACTETHAPSPLAGRPRAGQDRVVGARPRLDVPRGAQAAWRQMWRPVLGLRAAIPASRAARGTPGVPDAGQPHGAYDRAQCTSDATGSPLASASKSSDPDSAGLSEDVLGAGHRDQVPSRLVSLAAASATRRSSSAASCFSASRPARLASSMLTPAILGGFLHGDVSPAVARRAWHVLVVGHDVWSSNACG